MGYDGISQETTDKAKRLGPSLRRYQFVSWWPEWHGVFFHRFKYTGLRHIYEWTFTFAFWEVRKWKRGVSSRASNVDGNARETGPAGAKTP